jgi:putative FmdB family regulatory protein
MPTYNYECRGCGYAFEELRPAAAPDVEECPGCGRRGKVVRLLSAGQPGIVRGGTPKFFGQNPA